MARNKKKTSAGGIRSTRGGKLMRLFSFPEGCLTDVPYLELQGDACLSITGYEALLLYEDTNILFRMKHPARTGMDLLRVTGQDLTLSVLREGCLSVCGRIDAVILHTESDREDPV